jgi:hydrogenase maturation factor
MNDERKLLDDETIGCDIDAGVHCITCADEALPATVLHIDETLALARVDIAGETVEVDVSLLDGVLVGHSILVHGGVALARAGEDDR